MSIINGRRHDLHNYPFERLSEHLRKDLLDAASAIAPYFFEDMILSLAGLEYFCQAYDQAIMPDEAHASHNQKVLEHYCIAVVDGQIYSRSTRGNILLARYLLRCAETLTYVAKSTLLFSWNKDFELGEKFKQEIRSLPFNQSIHNFWKGWLTIGGDGTKKYLPLQNVYRSCGKSFTEKLYSVMDDYFRNRQRGLYGTWMEMLNEFEQLGRNSQLHRLHDPEFSKKFLMLLLRRFLSEARHSPNPVKYASLAIEWRNQFSVFVLEYLCISNILAFPKGGYPFPRGERVRGAHTNVTVTPSGTEVKEKLLTSVPLHVTDREAIEILFRDIQADISVIRTWAEKITTDIWEKYSRRELLASVGVALPISVKTDDAFSVNGETKSGLRSPNHPDYIANMAATFEKHGYLTNDDAWLQTLYHDRTIAAKELGLPSIKDIIAFCALLVLNHPELTKSALCSLRMFDKSGALTGIRYSDSGCYLVSYKRRSGATNAEKVVALNKDSTRIVEQLLKITEPLRSYLKSKGDDNWRYFFLHRGHSFAYPQKYTRSEIPSRDELKRGFRRDLSEIGVPDHTSDRLQRTFTLTRLRGSVGVAEYLKTTSVAKMARALGHKEYKKNLIDHYLPEPIRQFYEERWVRIFQAGIVCEAMKESPFLLCSSGFSSMSEIDEFLRNHVISFPDNSTTNTPVVVDDGEVIFALNEQILQLFCTLVKVAKYTPRTLTGLAEVWYVIAEKLITYIESDECLRPDIKEMLKLAAHQADPEQLRHLVQ